MIRTTKDCSKKIKVSRVIWLSATLLEPFGRLVMILGTKKKTPITHTIHSNVFKRKTYYYGL